MAKLHSGPPDFQEVAPEKMTRKEFLRLSSFAVAATTSGASPLPSAVGSRTRVKGLIPMLYGAPRHETDLDSWFRNLRAWGIPCWMAMLDDFRYSAENGSDARGHVVPFLSDALPEFRGNVDPKEEQQKAQHIRRQSECCQRHGLEFWCVLPFPLFPNQEESIIRKALPDLFANGKFDFENRRLPSILQDEIRSLKKHLPNLRGINLWMAEGAGSVPYPRAAIERAHIWQEPLVRALADVSKELDIGSIFFAHNYYLTVHERAAVHRMAASFPSITVMEDITWPEEDTLHPFLGYLATEDKANLFRSNPVTLNFLLDTEYIGQGILPSIYPRWWKHNISEAARAGAARAVGRTFRWDGGSTDVNFNRLNAHIFARLCHNPQANERDLLTEAARSMFGPAIPTDLIEVLWETEPVIQHIIGIDGIDPLSHSRFPVGETLDIVYMARDPAMKAVDDLFSPPGTKLYPPFSEDLSNLKQWRWQNRIVSRDPREYLSEKQHAVGWTTATLASVQTLSAPLSPAHRDLFVAGYQVLNSLAKGMELYTEAAALHHAWAHQKLVGDQEARAEFQSIANRLVQIAATVPDNLLGYRAGMLKFATFLEKSLPRIGKAQCSSNP